MKEPKRGQKGASLDIDAIPGDGSVTALLLAISEEYGPVDLGDVFLEDEGDRYDGGEKWFLKYCPVETEQEAVERQKRDEEAAIARQREVEQRERRAYMELKRKFEG